ncbi:MAG: undecaprenyl/decaprenyl-phosphate alpha-N-acetylglucosaminyl 1-phosphate transferase [Ruminococcus sp.]|nr:undecaprenyl/decaprenyl-phosphate alpha-N-acetylglucosaminyl 1-phosphate transferase [Candidatus Apopatosoma intestinale]
MYEYSWMPMAAAFFFSLLMTPVARRFAFLIGAVDVPRDGRRMHRIPTARLGGAAIAVGFFCALFLTVPRSALPRPGVLIGAALTAFLGAVDDKKALAAFPKLIAQIGIALCPVLSGVRIDFLDTPFGFWKLGVLGVPATVLFTVAVMNAFNLIDGIDGLSSGVASLASFSLACIALWRGEAGVAAVCLALCGAVLGFLPFNAQPASVFMGDTGSLFLGYVLAVASVTGMMKTPVLFSVGVPILAFAVPLFDTALAVVRRASGGVGLFSPDRAHLHHRLVLRLGYSPRAASSVLYGVTAMYCLAALLLIISPAAAGIVALLASGYLLLVYGLSGERKSE